VNKQILVMGFYQSGSSAFYDDIMQYEGVSPLMNKADDRLILEPMIFRNGLNIIWDSFFSEQKYNKDSIVAKFLCSGPDSIYKSTYQAKMSKLMIRQIGRKKINSIIIPFLDRTDGKDINVFIKESRLLILSFLEAYNKDGFIALSQCPDASRPDMICLYPDAYGFAICRDPKDNFVNLRDKRGKSLDSFITMYKNKMREYEMRIELLKDICPEYINKIKLISFEKFVNDSDFRKQCRQFIGISENKIRERFYPLISQKNSGMYKSELSIQICDKIDKELMECHLKLIEKYGCLNCL